MADQEGPLEIAEQREAELAAEISALNRLYRLSAQLLRPTELKSAMNLILDSSMEIVGATMGDVQIYDAPNQTTKILAHRGFTQEYIDRLQGVPLDDDSPCGRAIASGTRVIVEEMRDYSQSVRVRAMAAEARYRAMPRRCRKSVDIRSRQWAVEYSAPP